MYKSVQSTIQLHSKFKKTIQSTNFDHKFDEVNQNTNTLYNSEYDTDSH